MSRTTRSLAVVCFALLIAVPGFAQDPTGVRLDSFQVVPVKDGAAVTVNASVGVAGCDATHSIRTSLQLLRNGSVIAQTPIEVAGADDDAPPPKCTSLQNGSCAGATCPVMVVNGQSRSGICMNGSMILCSCFYGSVGATFENVDVAEGTVLQLVLAGQKVGPELSKANNYGAVSMPKRATE
ncbi:MAG TPA: hypothetical protein VF173_34820 [Thermoanaerobaculia bacterium]|nr:hypothetical protein [Thermoanaerobaculia bacterium]